MKDLSLNNDWDVFMNDMLLDEFFPTQTQMHKRCHQRDYKISEDDKAYHVQVIAAGLNKSDIKLDLKNDNLIISANKNEKGKEKCDTKDKGKCEWTLSTMLYHSFRLGRDIKRDQIKASLKDGILTVDIPKDDTKSLNQSIEIQ